MWLGEQIDEYGLGNGISLIILAGIVGRMPSAIFLLWEQTSVSRRRRDAIRSRPARSSMLIFSFIFIVAGSILITQAQRRIPIQQAKHTRGRRVYGGSRQFLPLRVNHGGVMPIIFAQTLMLFRAWPSAGCTTGFPNVGTFTVPQRRIQTPRRVIYIMTEVIMIYFFAYFWTTVQFQPKEMANQLRDYGSFIPGLRPGKRTADYR